MGDGGGDASDDAGAGGRSVRPDGAVEQLFFSRPRALPGVELLQARHTLKHYAMFHDRYAICLPYGAPAMVRYRQRTVEPHADALFLMEPGESHVTTRAHGVLTFDVVFIEQELVHGAAHSLGVRGPVHFRAVVERCPRAQVAMLSLLRSLVSEQADALGAQTAFQSFLAALVGEQSEQPAAAPGPLCSRRVQRAMAFLQEHYDDEIALEDLADAAGGVTTFHLIRMFRQVVGITPYAYALQLRIARARALLRSGRNVTAVAHEVGFGDQSHLHRQFKRIVGVTPGHYSKGASLVPAPAETRAR